MYQPLVPCPSCRRHVRSTEQSCPFCASSLPEDLRARPNAAPANKRLHRSVLFAAGAVAGAVVIGACSSSSDGTPTPPTDSGTTSDATSSDGTPDDGNPAVMYGPAPFDTAPDDDGAPMPKYGGPPVDSSAD